MSSIAQEESRSISENVTWGQRKRFADGHINLPYKQFLGYEKGENGMPKIVESEAKIVRRIYDMFYFKGKTPSNIAACLTEARVPTPSGKTVWATSTVESILTNEKYKGDALLQKTFTVDFLTKKKKINEGEIQQYYIEGSHPAIIQPEFFDLVQVEIKKRKGIKRSTAGIFASMLICGDCGNFYGSKVWHSTSKYRRTIWQCNRKFKNEEKCSTPHLSEETIKTAFVEMFNYTIENKTEIIETMMEIIEVISDTSKLDSKILAVEERMAFAAEQVRRLVNDNARRVTDQQQYEVEYKKRSDNYQSIARERETLETERMLQQNKRKEALSALNILKTTDAPITEFDENLFFGLVESIMVKSAEELIFNFRDGSSRIWNL